MNIREFSDYLLKLYQEMSLTFSSYQNATGLHCPPECGKCCLKPNIEATVFEMIPMALKIVDEGQVEEWLQKLENDTTEICLNYVPLDAEGKGRCAHYQERPSVCRMFGVAGYYNKRREINLSICKHLKTLYPNPVDSAGAPVMAQWSAQMGALDPRLIQEFRPINEALKLALQKVIFYAEYQIYLTEN